MALRRRYRWLIAALAVLVVLPLLAVLVVVLWIDPNNFRGPIERAAREQLGLPLTISGDLHWSLWPLLSIDTGAGAVGADPALLRWQQLQFGAQWRELSRNNFRIDRLAAEGLELNLQRDRDGRANWELLTGGDSPPGASSLHIRQLQLRNCAVRYMDEATNARWSAESLQVELELEFDSSAGAATLTELSIAAQLRGGPLPAAGVPVKLSTTRLAFSAAPATLRAASLRAQLANIDIAAELAEPLQFSPLTGAGTMTLNTASLRAALAAFGITAPPTRDARVLAALRVSTQWRADGQQFDFSALRIAADDTNLQGSAMWPLTEAMPAMFELKGDEMNADRYLRPVDQPGEPFELPIETLRAMRVQGVVSFDVMKMSGVTARGARFRLQSDEPQR